jgi:archaellum component FlaC
MKSASSELLLLVEPISNFSKAEKESHDLWRRYESSFNNLNSEITNGIDNYTTKLNKNIKDVFENYDSEIASAITNLSKMVQVIGDFVEDLESSLSKITNKVG